MKPSYYGFKDPKWMQSSALDTPLPEQSKPPANEDKDVIDEREETFARPNDGETGLKIAGLHKKYGKFTAINELSLSVNKGDLLSLLGSNGTFWFLFRQIWKQFYHACEFVSRCW